MTFIKYVTVFLLTILISMSSFANNDYSLYLVRHAEKQANTENPSLTSCGRLRAQQLATLLEDVPLQAIYSTQYNRTMATAQPISKNKQLAIKHYSPKDLNQFALRLKQLKQSALIVGHSNTTAELVAILSHIQTPALKEDQFQALYQLHFTNNEVKLTLLKQPLVCR